MKPGLRAPCDRLAGQAGMERAVAAPGRRAFNSFLACAWLAAGAGGRAAMADGTATATFPRLMGMNIGAKNYDEAAYQKELARLDVVILGFHRGWNPPGYAAHPAAAMRKAVQAIKSRNPNVRVGQYTVLNEAYDNPDDASTADLRDKLHSSKWWLLNASGRRVQWTRQYSTWEINLTDWARPDAGGRRWPQWLAERNHAVYFREIPEFDIVYLDNVMSPPRVKADWDRDGRDDDPRSPAMLAAHHAGHLAHWNHIRKLRPGALLVGNADNDLANAEWRGQLDGAFLEGMMGERWSIEAWAGWSAMLQRYRAVLRHVRQPGIVGFGVHGSAADYRFFRYGYATCLLDDGYFAFTDRKLGHSSVPWFDEYDFKLGRALSGPPAAAWSQDVWRRDFENGIVLVNPAGAPRTVAVGPGLRRLSGGQDPAVNNGAAVSQVTLGAKDGIVLRK